MLVRKVWIVLTQVNTVARTGNTMSKDKADFFCKYVETWLWRIS